MLVARPIDVAVPWTDDEEQNAGRAQLLKPLEAQSHTGRERRRPLLSWLPPQTATRNQPHLRGSIHERDARHGGPSNANSNISVMSPCDASTDNIN